MEVRDLTVRFGARTVLCDVVASAQEGAITVVVGPNAAGKSTVLRVCSGLLAPRHGTVLFRGENVHRMRALARARAMAFVPQRPTVSAGFTVREVITLGRFSLVRADERIADAMQQLGLAHLAKVFFHELSVGQQQRVSLARALVQHEQGAAIILDEPTSAMDLRHAQVARMVLRDVAARGATVIMAMHDIAAAADFGDHVWILDAGRMVGEGAPSELLSTDCLQQVFGVRYERVTRQGGSSTLVSSE